MTSQFVDVGELRARRIRRVVDWREATDQQAEGHTLLAVIIVVQLLVAQAESKLDLVLRSMPYQRIPKGGHCG